MTRNTIDGWTLTRWGDAPDVDIVGPNGKEWSVYGSTGEVDVYPESRERPGGFLGDCAKTRTIPIAVLVAALRMAGVVPGEEAAP